MLLVYAKNQSVDLTRDEAKVVFAFAAAIKAYYRSQWWQHLETNWSSPCRRLLAMLVGKITARFYISRHWRYRCKSDPIKITSDTRTDGAYARQKCVRVLQMGVGARQPSGAARALLRVMDKEPQAVLRALVSP